MAAPHRSVHDLLKEDGAADPKTAGTRGNFQDFDLLFEQLAAPAVMTLGHPLPSERFLPKRRAGSCHATHNEELLRDDER